MSTAMMRFHRAAKINIPVKPAKKQKVQPTKPAKKPGFKPVKPAKGPTPAGKKPAKAGPQNTQLRNKGKIANSSAETLSHTVLRGGSGKRLWLPQRVNCTYMHISVKIVRCKF
ncbi:hypothetical protein BC938DRAFT_482955 [Jimgerdemannia flammicorona]|uniref:Uncharacterized protein n=1 Tax=Jimgerdemannia flammicorona TaxID=994334 RepID=A0A433QW13_9FUNG|nr:hypothetical protein BC938DRAFT_482955 [Jimgerdemannia flammicorona]